jgi:hypothetical protein
MCPTGETTDGDPRGKELCTFGGLIDVAGLNKHLYVTAEACKLVGETCYAYLDAANLGRETRTY